ncbi:ATP-binding protein [Chitinophaga japonensis]|uniref:histidine kinase n=1 Tax=Chitinophaga japonensis TaxID=104662 RepID=A0A562TB88_CHIJA|nr:ATP-binding protein [Chitinophaga japonensis]TWI90867.1 signal transduction histidine kinase [Chitinophaga japonensis]
MNRSLILRIVVPILFVLAAVLGIKACNEHRTSSQRLARAVDTLKTGHPGLRLIDSALVILNAAESNFRLYTVVYEQQYLQTFSTQLDTVSVLLDSVGKPAAAGGNSEQLLHLIREKEQMSGKIASIKRSTDELLSRSLKDEMIDKMLNAIPPYSASRIKKEEVTIDTVGNEQTQLAKKGLFKRLGQAIANKNDTVKSKQTILIRTKDGKVMPKEEYEAERMRKILADVNGYYKSVLRQQLEGRTKIDVAEHTLAVTNLHLLGDLKKVIQTLKEQALQDAAARKFRAGADSHTSIRRMTGTMTWMLIVLLLAIAGAVVLYLDNRRKARLLAIEKQKALDEARSRSVFLANMSHEIRTPLNSIVGFAEQLGHTPLKEDQRELLHAVEVSADMLMEVVNDVLDFSKLDSDYISIRKEPFTLYQAVSDVVSTMRVQAARKQLDLLFSFEGGLQQHVQGDMFRLKQILINLIGNAIKYTETGSVTVTGKLENQDAQHARFTLSVADTGPGMPPEALPQIFERFYQARSPRVEVKGTGLGLAITQRLVKLHGGDITVESEVGKGSEFTFFIPYELASPPRTVVVTQEDVEKLNGNQLEGLYVLIADDQEMNLLLLKMILTRWKCRFDMAKDGATAYELFKTNRYDLVLLDLQMPQMSGVDVVSRIRTDVDSRKAKVPVLVLTADITRQDEESFRKAGFNDWMLKPFREKDIYKVIVKNLSKARAEAN